MNKDLLKKIQNHVLNQELNNNYYSDEFCGIFVDGRDNLKFEDIDAGLHSFRLYSENNYPIFLFLSNRISDEVVKKIYDKYKYIKITYIDTLDNIFNYSYWMFNNCFRLIPRKFKHCLTFQNDGFLIQKGWEEFVTKKEYSFIGAPWKSKIRALSNVFNLKEIQIGNGGVSYRYIPDLLEAMNLVNSYGGQHKVFRGVEIDGRLMQNNGWLAEDLMFTSIGFSMNIFKEIDINTARKFSLEPITFELFNDFNNKERPFAFHKIDA